MSYFGKKTPPKHGPGTMERKIKPNARYAGVGSRINSGSTIDKVRMVTNSEHLRRRDELFRRVSPGMLAELFAEYEPQGREDIAMASASGGGGGGGGGFTPRGAEGTGGIDSLRLGSPGGGGGAHASSSSSSSPSPPRRRLQGPRIVVHSPDTVTAPLPVEQPFLLLDVRSADAYRAGPTLRRARSFPAALLQRDNRFTADVVRFKNRPEALIVVYGDDEREAAVAATRFAEKGYDNVFVLSGGLRAFGQRHPEFVEGAPLPPLPGQQQQQQQKPAAAAAAAAAARSSDAAGASGRSVRGGRGGGGGGSPARTPPRMARGAGSSGGRQQQQQKQGPGGARRSPPMSANTLNRATLARHTAATGGGGRGNAAAASEAPSCASVAASVISRATERKGGTMFR